MNRLFVVLVVWGLFAAPLFAQLDSTSPPTPRDKRQVRATLTTLFDAMRAGDSAAARGVFADAARLQTALGPSDTPSVRTTSVDRFVEAVGQPHEAVWDERTWDVKVHVDGPLASAWVPYAFYLGEGLSHCGVNGVHLVQQADGWKILQLTDTRRESCDVPEEVRK